MECKTKHKHSQSHTKNGNIHATIHIESDIPRYTLRDRMKLLLVCQMNKKLYFTSLERLLREEEFNSSSICKIKVYYL